MTGPDGPVSLATLIADDPKGQLGPEVAGEFGARLPYLMKVLAAESPLSLQAHPGRGLRAPGVRRAARPTRTPRATTRTRSTSPRCSSRSRRSRRSAASATPSVSADVLAELELPALAPVIAALRRGADGLREAVRLLLTWPAEDRPALVEAVVRAAAGKPDSRYAESLALATNLASRYPGDPGVLVALLLNHVRLAPGEAIWMPAGNLHAYLHGAGVEIMAASDNVLRGGLTPKRVDVDELLRVLRFEVLHDPILPATEVAPGVVTWQVPVREFALYRIQLDGTRPPTVVPAAGPRIVVGIEGDVFVAPGPRHADRGERRARPRSPRPTPGPITVAGVGEVFVAAVPA